MLYDNFKNRRKYLGLISQRRSEFDFETCFGLIEELLDKVDNLMEVNKYLILNNEVYGNEIYEWENQSNGSLPTTKGGG